MKQTKERSTRWRRRFDYDDGSIRRYVMIEKICETKKKEEAEKRKRDKDGNKLEFDDG